MELKGVANKNLELKGVAALKRLRTTDLDKHIFDCQRLTAFIHISSSTTFLFKNWYFLDRKSFNHIHNLISNLKFIFFYKNRMYFELKRENIFVALSLSYQKCNYGYFLHGYFNFIKCTFSFLSFFGKLCWMYFYLFDLGLLWTARSVLPSAWPNRFPIERLRLHKINFPQWNSPSDWTPFRWPGSHSGIFFYYICMENMKHRLCSKARTYLIFYL